MERSKEIFGNIIKKDDYKKACKNQKKFIHKFGDDRNCNYNLGLVDNSVLTPVMGVKNIVLNKTATAEDKNIFDKIKNPIIIGNIRMGFGHYRISMAMSSAAHSLGLTPLWFDLNSFPETTCTKIIAYQNDLYSFGSRLSQKSHLFNKLVWEPMNYEGFKKLSYNAADQKNAELMTPLFNSLPRDTPFIATHVWPSQAAIHSGMTHVVNAIPDNWPMALHLSEGALHTVQTQNTYWGYRTLKGFEGDTVLNPMAEKDILYTGHYIDDEIVRNIEADCKKRIERVQNKKPMRFLLTIGGAGAQGEFFAKIIKTLLPYVKQNKACIYINCGDYINVWETLKKDVPELLENNLCKTHFNDWVEASTFGNIAIDGDGATSDGADAEKDVGQGVHVFCNKDVFAAVYLTNILMRASDVLVTKPSELAFYPVPKLFIRRIGGHEMWGAIHSSDLGDGTPECETSEYASSIAKSFIEHPEYLTRLCDNIKQANKCGIYDGAYKAVKAALKGRA